LNGGKAVHGRQAVAAYEAVGATATATADETEGFGEQSRRVGVEWRRVDEEQRAALVRKMFDDLAALRLPKKRRR
jgi:hypothetical protein